MADTPTWSEWITRDLLGLDPDKKRLEYLRSITMFYGLLAFALGLLVVGYAVEQGKDVAMLWAFASAAAMASLGFLFGIPKTAQTGAPPRFPTKKDTSPKPGATVQVPADAGTPAKDAEGKGVRHFVNTNLEDISDWLTKAIVGVALIEWRPIFEAVDRGAATLAAGITVRAAGNSPIPVGSSLAASYAVMVYFGAGGFLFGYIYTRLFLGEVFRLADTQATLLDLHDKVEELQVKVAANTRDIHGKQ